MDDHLDPLEKIFQKVEEESERRAKEEEALGTIAEEPSTEKKRMDRRRGSVSISRIGKIEDELALQTQAPLTPTVTSLTSNSPYYKAHIANGSTTSIASGASAFSGEHAHREDPDHVTQMEHIVGKQSISARLMPRRLSRANSTSMIPNHSIAQVDASMIIGVSVQEASVGVPSPSGQHAVTVERKGTVQALGTASLRSKPSKTSLSGAKTSSPSWLAKAKGFSLKFRRKAKPSIPA